MAALGCDEHFVTEVVPIENVGDEVFAALDPIAEAAGTSGVDPVDAVLDSVEDGRLRPFGGRSSREGEGHRSKADVGNLASGDRRYQAGLFAGAVGSDDAPVLGDTAIDDSENVDDGEFCVVTVPVGVMDRNEVAGDELVMHFDVGALVVGVEPIDETYESFASDDVRVVGEEVVGHHRYGCCGVTLHDQAVEEPSCNGDPVAAAIVRTPDLPWRKGHHDVWR